MDVESLAAEFARRKKSYLWESADPDIVAAWVLGESEGWADLQELAGAEEALPAAEAAFATRADYTRLRAEAFALVGGFTRMAVPLPQRTAQRSWLIALQGKRLVRLTVGLPEVAYAVWNEQAVSVGFFLRIAASPIDAALANGELNGADLDKWEIERLEKDPYQTQASDAALYWCPSPAAAEWFLGERSVRVASRLMCARLVLDGRAPRARHYSSTLAAEAWAAAEIFFEEPDGGEDEGDGFDRPYRGQPRQSDYPTFTLEIDAAAHHAAGAEHHRLCVRLIECLADHGIAAGERVDPPVDVAWRLPDGRLMIAEVKSCLGVDDTAQMRLGLGQVLQYRHRLAQRGVEAEAVLLVSKVPDPLWHEICGTAGVLLISGDDEQTWPTVVGMESSGPPADC